MQWAHRFKTFSALPARVGCLLPVQIQSKLTVNPYLVKQLCKPMSSSCWTAIHAHKRRHFVPKTTSKTWLHGYYSTIAVPEKSSTVGRFDFTEEEDLRKLLDDVRNLFDDKNFLSAGLPKQAKEHSELLVKYLCLCQCSPANIIHIIQNNPQMLRTPWALLQKVIFILEEIGLKRGQLLKALDQHQLLWELDESSLRKRLGLLRGVGFNEGLKKLVAKWPQILTIPSKQINSVVETLKTCDFSRSEICVIIQDHPAMLRDAPEEIALKFQYVHFCMGIVEGKELVHGKIFKYPLDHIRTRHILLDRMGLYHAPDKHKIYSANNPRLQMIIDSTDSRFCQKVVKSGMNEEDFQLFKKNLRDELKVIDDRDEDSEDSNYESGSDSERSDIEYYESGSDSERSDSDYFESGSDSERSDYESSEHSNYESDDLDLYYARKFREQEKKIGLRKQR